MALWRTRLRLNEDLRLLVTSPEGDDLIKARLPLRPPHPRALLTMLEGIALFSGEPLYAVISAGSHQDAWLGSEQWCEFAIPAPRVRRRLRGVGDFRDVRRELRLVWSR